MQRANSPRATSLAIATLLLTALCTPAFPQISQDLTITATLNTATTRQLVIVEVAGEASCPQLSGPTISYPDSGPRVRFDYSGHCPILPPGPGPFSLFALLPHLGAGTWDIELFDLDVSMVVATTQIQLLDPNFAINVEPTIVTDATDFTIITSGFAYIPIPETPLIDGNTIRIDINTCPICTGTQEPNFVFEHEIDALNEGVYTIEVYYNDNLVAIRDLNIVPADSCVPSATTICLDNGRFQVTASWETPEGATGPAFATEETDDTGLFWFFDEANIELVVKTIDACNTPSDSFWIFAGGLTDLGVTLEVTDTVSDTTVTYENPVGERFQTITDTAAFSTCP